MGSDPRIPMNAKSEEIAAALRRELDDLKWKPGEKLPSVGELRERFGVGEFAVRAALKRLRDDGFISLRQNAGAVVTLKASCAFVGRVVFVTVGAHASYFTQKFSISLSRRLCLSGYLCESVFLDGASDAEIDVVPLKKHLASGVDLVVGLISSRKVAQVLDSAGVPYVILNGYTRDFPNAVGTVCETNAEAYESLIRALVAKKVRTLLEFDYERTMDRSFKHRFFAAGISIRRVLIKWENDRHWSLSDVKACGHRAVSEFFADDRNKTNPPDAVLFDDDYLAAGGILALYEAGFRVPQDIKVVFYSNKGNEPVLGVSAARIENDPVAYAETVAEYVLAILAGKKVPAPEIPWRFIDGDSL